MTEQERCPTCESDERGLLVGECADRATRYGEGKRVRLRLVDPWHLNAESRVQELERELLDAECRRDELRVEKDRAEACEASYRRRVQELEGERDEAWASRNHWKRAATENLNQLRVAESHLARLEEALEDVAQIARGESEKAGKVDLLDAIEERVAAALTHSTPEPEPHSVPEYHDKDMPGP